MKAFLSRGKKHLPAYGLFILLALGMTFPLIFHSSDHLPSDLGDPLYNVWAMAWNAHQLSEGGQGFWDANIFYPHHGTLLYADYIFALSLLHAPLAAFSGNVIFAYNILFIFSFFLSALGMYHLVFHLSGSKTGAVMAGIIFAFFPYRFAHISHLELLYSAWMPFCLLFLHKFIENLSWKSLFGAGALLVIQALSCAYYGVHLALFAGLFILFFASSEKLLFKKAFWLKIGAVSLFVCILLAPFFYPYLKVHGQMEFARSLNIVKFYSAQLQHFLAVPPWNLVWGKITGSLGAQEWQLYPGLVPVLLAVGLFFRRRRHPAGGPEEKRRNSAPIFYLETVLLAWLLSLGPVIRCSDRELFPGPYRILYNWVPGFRGLRVPSRFAVIMMLGLAVLSGLALARWLGRQRRTGWRICVPILLAGMALAEYASFPIPLARVNVGSQIPPIYSLVKEIPQESPLIEFPIPPRGLGKSREALYIYYSTYHWRRLVNGYSGYIPPAYVAIGEAMEGFPSEPTFRLLRNLGVEYVLVHTGWFLSEEGKRIVTGLKDFTDQAGCLAAMEGDYLYRLLPAQKTQDEGIGDIIAGKEQWKAASNVNWEQTRLAFDGRPETGWSTGRPQRPGDYFLLDLGSLCKVRRLEMSLSGRPLDFPRGYLLEGSVDGNNWTSLNENRFSFPELDPATIEDYSKYQLVVSFPDSEVRYLRMRLTRGHERRPWSIQEIVCRGESTGTVSSR
ncbi:MAG: discoidin domain-containing protein [Candidatus Aminicenantales bacterium]